MHPTASFPRRGPRRKTSVAAHVQCPDPRRPSMSDSKPLAGQVAWVTGSSRGLGRAMATTLCRMGAAVAVHGTRFDSPRSFNEGESIEQVARDVAAEAGGTAVPVWGDV